MAESKDIFPLKIGNITTGLIIDTKYMPGLHERYAGFKDDSNVDFSLECQEDDKVRNTDKYAKLQALLRELKPAEGDILPAHVQRLLCPKANLTHDQLVIQDDLSFKIELDLSKKRGMLHFHPRHRIFGYRNNFFHASLKNLYAALSILYSEGFLMHSSAVDLNGDGALFFGESGAGKTTICTMFGEENILNDEINLISKSKRGVQIYSTPFLGSLVMQTRHRHVKLKRAFSIVQATSTYVQEISLKESLKRAINCIAMAQNCNELERKAFGNLMNILDEESWQALHFSSNQMETTGTIASNLSGTLAGLSSIS